MPGGKVVLCLPLPVREGFCLLILSQSAEDLTGSSLKKMAEVGKLFQQPSPNIMMLSV